MIKAILFDMDGVIVDAKEWHYESLNKSLKLFGYEIGRLEHLEKYDGLPTKIKLKMLSEKKGLPDSLSSLINKVKQIYTSKLMNGRCRPMFIHQLALFTLKKEGYKIAVCSNSIRKTVEVMLSKTKLIDYVDFFISNEDVENPKPHPEMYIKASKRFNLHPKECLVIEDNIRGIKSATSSGCELMVVDNIYDVTLKNIKQRIKEIENEGKVNQI